MCSIRRTAFALPQHALRRGAAGGRVKLTLVAGGSRTNRLRGRCRCSSTARMALSFAGVRLLRRLGYLFGSIPFGLLLTRLAGHGDLRTIGSGNIGATNVLRTGRKDLAAATLLLDA